MKIIVTTSQAMEEELVLEASEIACNLGLSYIPRNKTTFKDLLFLNNAEAILVVSKGKISCYFNGEELFFHPSMAKLRIKTILNGENDSLLTYLGIKPGDSVLDCTLGLGSDALVASFIVGNKGKVTALESSPIISFLVARGLKEMSGFWENIAKRIEVNRINYVDFLNLLPENSYDIVYFDPMFRQKIKKSSSMNPLRAFANSNPLTKEVLEKAFRVCRKRVVVKEKRHSKEFTKLGIDKVVGSKSSSVAYGILEKEGELNGR